MEKFTNTYKNKVLSEATKLEWAFFFTANGNGLDLEWQKEQKYRNYDGRVKSTHVDFYYEDETGEIKIAIECDDSSHKERLKLDKLRDASLADKGIKVFRFETREIIWNCLACVKTVKDYIVEEKKRSQKKSYSRKFHESEIKVELV